VARLNFLSTRELTQKEETGMSNPIETVNELSNAINRGNLEAALALYEPDAVMVGQPGQLARGSKELRAALGRFIALKPELRSETQNVIEAGDTALYTARWSLRGTDPSGKATTMGGVSSDVLRRQRDGRWLIAVDNPWGAKILDGPA
jgi:uncharacterized protein (TIGR02246 family)